MQAKTPATTTQNRKQLWLLAGATLAIFAISTLVRFYLADFPKQILVYQDELRYWNIARSLWQNGSIAIRNVPTDFSKILYSLVLAPLFAIQDPTAQVRAVALLNSLVLSSSVFPALLLAKKGLRSRWAVLAVVATCAILPDMAYSMTFMSEVTAFPVTLWVVWLMWQALDADTPRQSLLFGGLAGLASYVLYLNKEIGLAFCIAFALCMGWQAQRLPQSRKKALGGLGVYAAVFGALFLLCKLTLFAGMGNSYNMANLDYLDSLYKWFYLAYSFCVNSFWALLAFYVFPVLLPLALLRKGAGGKSGGRANTQSLYGLCLLALVVSIATVCFTVSIREDLGRVLPRQHIRYYAALFIPFLVTLLAALEQHFIPLRKALQKRLPLVAAATTGFCTLCLFLLRHQTVGRSVLDNTSFKYMEAIFSNRHFFKNLYAGNNELEFATGIWTLRILCIVGVAGGVYLLYKGKKRIFLLGLAAAVVGTSLLNNLAAVQTYVGHYELTETAAYHQAVELDEMLAAEKDAVLVVLPDADPAASRMLDTYFSSGYSARGNMLYSLTESDGTLQLAGGDLNYALTVFGEYARVPAVTEIRYILCIEGETMYTPAPGSVEEIPLTGEGPYRLYRNLTPGTLALVPEPEDEPAAE